MKSLHPTHICTFATRSSHEVCFHS
ncbi:hypothetical protein Pint_06998 [Pistacia integerrima]|uniref:Uncharacterized protein n=1 Tax=Pistacia integerrima TaxID=434235 RepID=A0ACC0XX85_9ROSI|nr:hypothetical protein Pint_06998 [Pistacia integerrima]